MSDKKLVKSAGGVLGFVGGGVLSLIPEINIIGYVLVLIAMRGLSRAYNNDVIWRNAVPAVAMSITGMIIANFAYVKAMTVAILGPLATNSWEPRLPGCWLPLPRRGGLSWPCTLCSSSAVFTG